MPSVYDLKPRFQALLRPLVDRLAGAGITPNQVTITAVFLSVSAGGAVALFPAQKWPLLVIPLVLFVRMALNAMDGMLAREHQMQSPQGTVLNELGDVLSDVALYLPLFLVPGISAVWVVAVVLLAVISEMTGVLAVLIGAKRRYDGPMGKSDRAFVLGVLCLILGLGLSPGPWVDYLLIAMLPLIVLTIVNRARRALGEVS